MAGHAEPAAFQLAELPGPERDLGVLIRRAHQVHAGLWRRCVAHSLTPVQFGVLLALRHGDTVDEGVIAERMSLDPRTVTDVVRRLRSGGLVFSTRAVADGQRMLTRLSDAGRATLVSAAPAVVEVQTRLLAPVRSDEKAHLLRMLRLVAYPENSVGSAPYAAVAHLIRVSLQLHASYWAQEVSTELTATEFGVLLVLWRDAPMSKRMVIERAFLDPAPGAEALSRVQSSGLVLRVRDNVDGRRHRLVLSENGVRQLGDYGPSVRAVERRLLQAVPAHDRLTLTGLLAKVARVVG